MMITRRGFVGQVAALATVSSLHSQENTRNEWGGPVVDCHHHLRRTLDAIFCILIVQDCGYGSFALLGGSIYVSTWDARLFAFGLKR